MGSPISTIQTNQGLRTETRRLFRWLWRPGLKTAASSKLLHLTFSLHIQSSLEVRERSTMYSPDLCLAMRMESRTAYTVLFDGWTFPSSLAHRKNNSRNKTKHGVASHAPPRPAYTQHTEISAPSPKTDHVVRIFHDGHVYDAQDSP